MESNSSLLHITQLKAFTFAAAAWIVVPGCEHDDLMCTTIGCSDGSLVEVRLGAEATEFLAVEVTVDGETTQCTAPTLTHLGACSRSSVAVTPETKYTCTDAGTTAEACQTTGAFAQSIFVNGQSAEFTIVLTSSTGATWSRTFQPSYEEQFPNGAECGPVCSSASLLWELK